MVFSTFLQKQVLEPHGNILSGNVAPVLAPRPLPNPWERGDLRVGDPTHLIGVIDAHYQEGLLDWARYGPIVQD